MITLFVGEAIELLRCAGWNFTKSDVIEVEKEK